MVSNLQLSWRFDGLFLVGLLVLLGTVRSSEGYVSKVFQAATEWSYAHATFYGDDSASETMGGACGYGNLRSTGYGTDTAALSTNLFNNGYACGSCYEIKCVESPWCLDNGGTSGYGSTGVTPIRTTTIKVTATNLCPPNWYQSSDDGGWCNPPRQHFDLAKPAFNKIATTAGGIVPIMYKRVPCAKTGGMRFLFEGNPYWLLVYVMNVGGSGDVCQMWVKGSKSNEWITMSHNWGVSYQAFSQLGGQILSFKVQSCGTKETIILHNVTPQYWCAGTTYEADSNFY